MSRRRCWSLPRGTNAHHEHRDLRLCAQRRPITDGGGINLLADPTKVRAVSARTAPAAQVHPEVIAAMAEVGLDLRNAGGYFRIAPYRATQLSLHTLIPPFVPDAQRRAIEAKRPDPCGRVAASS